MKARRPGPSATPSNYRLKQKASELYNNIQLHFSQEDLTQYAEVTGELTKRGYEITIQKHLAFRKHVPYTRPHV
jgi:predicted SAM-dependent methyltransferase